MRKPNPESKATEICNKHSNYEYALQHAKQMYYMSYTAYWEEVLNYVIKKKPNEKSDI